MATKNSKREIRQQFIQQHLITWQQSGMSAAAYCRQYNLVRQTFYGWIKKQKNTAATNNDSKGRFLPVKINDNPEVELTGSLFAEVCFPHGKSVRFYQPVGPSLILQLLQAQ